MKTNKYQTLDEAICNHIRNGGCHPVNSTALQEIARTLAIHERTYPVAWRLIDRRIQAMRKVGILAYKRTKGRHGQWVVVEPKECD